MQLFRADTALRALVIFGMLCIMMCLAWTAYAPGLIGSFTFDDGPNIVQNSNLAISHFDVDHITQAAFSSDSGLLKRPISMLSFAANETLTGLSPYYFKLTNLAIHVINGLSLYFLTLLLLDAVGKRLDHPHSFWQCQSIALTTAAGWLLHPLNLTSVLYIVQRMTSLSSLFTIWGLIAFTWGRMRMAREQGGCAWLVASLLVFLPLSALCKEIGLLLPAYMLAIELSLFQFQASLRGKRFLATFFGLTIVLPALAFLTYVAMHPSWLPQTYIGRAFTLEERVMTQARILWFYIKEIIAPVPSQMGLFHDDIPNSHSLFDPVSTIWSIAGLLALLIVGGFARKKAPLITFAILFFFAGHVLESSVWPLEMVHEHRNYLPMFGILLAIFYYLLYPFRYTGTLPFRQFVSIILIALFTYDTWSRAVHWTVPFDFAQYEVENHPNSARDNLEMGNNYASIRTADTAITEAYYWRARHYYERSAALDPNYTTGLFAALIVSSRDGRSVDPAWIADLQHRLEFSPSEPDIGNNLTLLVQAKIQKSSNLEDQILLNLINAALKNPTNVGGKRALILASLEFYLVDLAHDYPGALDTMYQMVDAAPQELEGRLSLIQMLAAMQKPEEAKKQLEIAKNMDRLHTHTLRISEIERQLNGK